MMTKSRERLLCLAFGALFLIVMLVLAILVPEPTGTQFFTFRVVLAIAAAATAAMVPGFLEVNLGKVIKAGGAIGVFVIVYSTNPAMFVASVPPARSVTLNKLEVGKIDEAVNAALAFEIVEFADSALAFVEIDVDEAFPNPVRHQISHPEQRSYSVALDQPTGATIHARIVAELGSHSLASRHRTAVIP